MRGNAISQNDNDPGKVEAIQEFLNHPELLDIVKPNTCEKQLRLFIMLNQFVSRDMKLVLFDADVMIGNKNELFFKCEESDYLVFNDMDFNGNTLKVDFTYMVKKEPFKSGSATVKKSGSDWVVKKFKID